MPIYPALMKKKAACFLNLKKAMKYEKELAKHNVETLMLRGIRNPGINTDEMKAKISTIDKIALALFGRTDSLGDATPLF